MSSRLPPARVLHLATALAAYQLLYHVLYRVLVLYCGEWYARTTTVVVLVPLSALGSLVNAAWVPSRYSLYRLVGWMAVGYFGFVDMQGVAGRVAGAIFGGMGLGRLTADGGGVGGSDVGVLKRCVFVGAGAGWVAGVAIGYVLWWCVREVFGEREQPRHSSSSSSSRSSSELYAYCGLQCVSVGVFLWDVLGAVVPYPDCGVPLLGVGAVALGMVLELRRERTLWVLGSAVIGVGVSYGFNSYLQCGYCGAVAAEAQVDTAPTRAVWRCPLREGGVLQVVDVDVDERYRLRAVRLGHSIMGGMWTAPADVSGMPIFSAFHLQAALGAVYAASASSASSAASAASASSSTTATASPVDNKRSLHVGLGIGGSVTLLQGLGYTSDCVELHPQMVQVAREFFHLNGTACQIGDANQLLVPTTGRNGNALPLEAYDVIIVDIFSGDADAVVRNSKGLFDAIAQSSMIRKEKKTHHQQVVVNYFGIQGYQLHALYEAIRQSFSDVHVYREDPAEAVISNFVILASHEVAVSGGGANNNNNNDNNHLSKLLKTAPFSRVFADYTDHITDVLDRREIVPTSTCGDVKSVPELVRQRACMLAESLSFAGAHFRAMRGQFYI